MLQRASTSLRTLAEATDGLAVVNNNDLSAGLRRVTSDLTSYYLLGYYSSGKLDGKFHSITVRVKRPGVQVRARRGYLAPTLAEANARTAAAAAPTPLTAEEVEAKAVEAAVAPLGGFTRELPLRVQLAAGWKPDHTPVVWAVGEIGASEARGDGWQTGGVADVLLSQSGGGTMAEAHATLAAGTRTFRVALAPAQPLAPGAYDVRIRAHGAQRIRHSDQRGRARDARGGARADRRGADPPGALDGQQGDPDGGPALPPERAAARGSAGAGGDDGDGAAAGPAGQAAGGARHGRRARRGGRLALGDGRGDARAAGAGRVRDRADRRRGRADARSRSRWCSEGAATAYAVAIAAFVAAPATAST